MGQLIDGEWRIAPLSTSSSGEFLRPSSTFRDWIGSRGSRGQAPEDVSVQPAE